MGATMNLKFWYKILIALSVVNLLFMVLNTIAAIDCLIREEYLRALWAACVALLNWAVVFWQKPNFSELIKLVRNGE